MSASESATVSSTSATCKSRACRSGPGSPDTSTSPSARFCCTAFSERRTWTSAEETPRRQTTTTATGLPTRLGWFCLADSPSACLGPTGPPPTRPTQRPTSREYGGATVRQLVHFLLGQIPNPISRGMDYVVVSIAPCTQS
ncbi:unnamed protein product [Ectocarpus fasciculatus]